MKPVFLILGFGYTASALATHLPVEKFDIVGTSRSVGNKKESPSFIKLLHFNSIEVESYISRATHILICIPPTQHGDDVAFAQYATLIKNQAAHLKWMGYLSSTSVYGDYQGDWVNEKSACTPHTPTGIARLNIEQSWLSYAKKNTLPLHIFRLSGIYGPGRNALERLIQGKKFSLYKEGQVFCRIHVEDIVSTLLASIRSPQPLSIYNVSDDEPAPSHLVDEYAAKLLNQAPLPVRPFNEAELSLMEQEFYSNNRRVCNLKIKQTLGIVLKYPSYKEGLTQIWKNK